MSADDPKLVMLQISHHIMETGILGETPKELKTAVSEKVAAALRVSKSRVRVTEIVAEKEGDALTLQLIVIIMPAAFTGDASAASLALSLVEQVREGKLLQFKEAHIFDSQADSAASGNREGEHAESETRETGKGVAVARYYYQRRSVQ